MSYALALLLAFAATSAAAAEPLLLARSGGNSGDPALRLLFSVDAAGVWRSVDAQIATAVPARLADVQAGAEGAAAPMTLAAWSTAVFGEMRALDTWYARGRGGAATPFAAVDARPFQWSCNRGWGLRAAAEPPPDVLLADRAVTSRYFRPAPQRDLSSRPWRPSDPESRVVALHAYRRLLRDRSALGDIDAAVIAALPLRSQQVRSVDLGSRGQLVWVATSRLLRRDAGTDADACSAPSLIETALFHADATGRVQRRYSFADVQDCSDGWSPAPRVEPWLLLELGDELRLLQFQYGIESESVGVYRLDAERWIPSERPELSGGENGC